MSASVRQLALRRRARRLGLAAAWLALDLGLCLLLAALPALFFWRILATTPGDAATFPLGDFTELHYPYRNWAAEELARGTLPTWNPYLSAGHPSLGDIQFGLLYPIGRLFAEWYHGDLPVLGLEQQVIVHFSIAAVGTFLFARAAGLGRVGAVTAAVAFTFAGYMTTFPVQQIIILQTSVWLPWILFGLEAGVRRREPLAGLIVAAATAMAALVGHPQTLGYVLGLSLVYGLYRLARTPSLGGLLGAAVGGLAGLGLAAPALLPALEHLRLTARTDVTFAFTATGFAPREILGLLVPTDVGGRPLYAGALVGALALIGALVGWRAAGFWVGAFVVSLLLSFGANTFLYPAAYALVPGLQFFRNHERAALVFSFALAMLAGRGAAEVVAPFRHTAASAVAWAARAAGLAAALAFALAVFLQYVLLTLQGDVRNQVGALGDRLFLTALFAALAAALIVARGRAALGPRTTASALVALLIVDLFTAGWTLNLAPGQPEKLLRPSPTARFLQTALGPLERVASEGTLPADGNAGALFRIPDIVGNSPLDLEAYRTFGEKVDEFQRWRLLGVRMVVTRRKLNDPRLPLVFQENDLMTYELRAESRLPRAWLVHRAIVVGSREDELEATRRIKADEEVVLPIDPGPLDGQPPDRPVSAGTAAAILDDRDDWITLRSWSPRAAVLVLSERDYPGWRATVDDEPAPLLRANDVLRGLYLTPGPHQITLAFTPPGLTRGLELAGSAIVGLEALVAVRLLGFAVSEIASRGILRRRSDRAPRRRPRRSSETRDDLARGEPAHTPAGPTPSA